MFNKFGLHWVALQCGDIHDKDWLRAKFRQFKREWGASWIKLITSPGGDAAWQNKPLGCSEWALKIALEEGLKPVVRIFRGRGAIHYWDADVEANLRRLISICDGYVLPVEPANEIDVEWDGKVKPEDAKALCWATAEFCHKTLEMGGILPLFPSVGYGGSGMRFLQVMHNIGQGDLFDKIGIAIHPYRGPYPLDWGTSYELKEMTRDEYESYHPWCWAKGAADYVSFDMVNEARRREIANRLTYTSYEHYMAVYNYGWFTIDWAAYQLGQLGHDPANKFYLTECGVEVGAKDIGIEVRPNVRFSMFPRVDPKLHEQMTLEQIYAAENDPRIAMTAFWLPGNLDYAGNTNNWESQAWESAWYNPNIIKNLPWPGQIKTAGRLPIVDKLIEINSGAPIPPEPPKPPKPEPGDDDVSNDAESYGVKIEPASTSAEDKYWKAVKVHHLTPSENNGNHNLYVNVYNEDGSRMNGARVLAKNANGVTSEIICDKPSPEPMGNCPMYKGDTYEVWVPGLPSEHVVNVHTRHPDEASGNTLFHHSFLAEFRLTKRNVTPTPEPEPEPTPTGTWVIAEQSATRIVMELKTT